MKAKAKANDAKVLPSISFEALKDRYARASIFWHLKGYGETMPNFMEHFGMTTVESMASGCVPIAINRGGQPEIIEHGKSGWLWEELDELRSHTLHMIRNPTKMKKMSKAATKRSEVFGIESFSQSLSKEINRISKELERRGI